MDIEKLKKQLQEEYEASGHIHGWITKTAAKIKISDQVLSGILSGKFRGEYKTWELIQKYLKKVA